MTIRVISGNLFCIKINWSESVNKYIIAYLDI